MKMRLKTVLCENGSIFFRENLKIFEKKDDGNKLWRKWDEIVLMIRIEENMKLI